MINYFFFFLKIFFGGCIFCLTCLTCLIYNKDKTLAKEKKMELITEKIGKWVLRCSFEQREYAKKAGFRWDPAGKQWWTDQPEKAARLIQYANEETKANHTAIEEQKAAAREQSRATDAAIDIPAPTGLTYLPYQKAGIAYAINRANCLIGDEMGLGKTIQAIGVINADPTIRRVLVICPASLKINWLREMNRWLVIPHRIAIANGTFPTEDIVIINYDILKKHAASLRAMAWDLLIIDEAHYLKNPKALRTIEVLGKYNKDLSKAITPIPAKQKIFLTGTPITNRPIELWPILHSTGS